MVFAPCISASKHKYVVYDARQAAYLLVDYRERLPVLGLAANLALQHYCGSSSYDGERRAQFMRSVRHKLPLLRKGIAESRKQLVKSGGETAKLIAWISSRQPLVKVLDTDTLRTLRHRYYRCKAPAS